MYRIWDTVDAIIPALTPMTAYPPPTAEFLTTDDQVKLLTLLHPHEQEYQKFACRFLLGADIAPSDTKCKLNSIWH